ncbi:aminoacetone oxidase family FAD-binding enzyme, partial [Oceanispirochaeta sp.]|uniref:aminoacetone oxidase family FAD-binding enzyme n=1 Tax=Oceanispirochaeta sp. TaxID=2035350 RepID=UPI0026342706
MVFDLVIIGGGAAGLFAGTQASEAGLNFCILESMKECGLKLLASGSGQCNLTQGCKIAEFPAKYGQAFRFVKPALFGFDNKALISYFEKQGLPCADRGDGKFFPASRKSRDVRDLLLALCRKGGQIRWKQRVLSLVKEDNIFLIRSDTELFRAKNVLLASGGQSYTGTGSTGEAYNLPRSLGHTLVPPRPALTPVFINPFPLMICSGTALSVSIDLFRKGQKSASFNGDLLITHKGFSGPVILNNSRIMEEGDELRLCWLPDMNRDALDQEILERIQYSGKKTARSGLARKELTDALTKALLDRAGIDPEKKISQLIRKDRISWLNTL